ncbi:MAG: hypothetical protein IKB93_04180 [Clostridia bacterium]|nr:hypothetical protein [Clostridia bacterium]
MKKYNKPEIETLALETVDVIAASAYAQATVEAINGQVTGNVKGSDATISQFVDTGWSW